jgi:hypothetical protein
MRWGTNRSVIWDGIATWANSRIPFRIHLLTDDDKRAKAFMGFKLLDMQPKPLWLAYVQMTERANPTNEDLDAICGINWLVDSGAPKEMVVPAFTRVIQNTNSVLAQIAAFKFAVSYPEEAAAAGVFKNFPTLKSLQQKQADTNNSPESK